MNNIDTQDFELIIKYVSGNASPAEREELEAWVLADPDHMAQFKAVKKTWILAGMKSEGKKVDVEAAWEKVSREVEGGNIRDLRSSGIRWLGLAAAAVALLILAYWLFNRSTTEIWTYATTDQPKVIELKDGTTLSLNRNSKATFDSQNAEGERRLELEGVAFLEVVEDSLHPFVVTTPQLKVRVLGTSFLVEARKDDPKERVVLQSGKVEVRAGKMRERILPREQVVFDREKATLTKESYSDPNLLSFRSDTLIFKQTPLREVVIALNRHFDADISIADKALAECPLTATYTNESLENILRFLSATFQIEVRRKADKIILEGSC